MFFIICRCCPSSCAVSTNQGNSLSFLMTLLMSCLGIYLLLKCKSLGYNMAFQLRSEFHCIHMYTKMITFLILPKSSLSVLTCSCKHIVMTSYCTVFFLPQMLALLLFPSTCNRPILSHV